MSDENWVPLQTPLWQARADWPMDYPEAELLPRATNRLGRVLFGDAWRGDEMGVDPTFVAPRLPNLNRGRPSLDEVRTIHELLTAHRPQLPLKPLRFPRQSAGGVSAPPMTVAPPPTPTPPPRSIASDDLRKSLAAQRDDLSKPPTSSQVATYSALAAALSPSADQFFEPNHGHVLAATQVVGELRAAHAARVAPLLERRAVVSKLLCRTAIHGLPTFWQGYNGSLCPIPATTWNLEIWRHFVETGKIDWQHHVLTGSAKRAAYLSWIFVSTDALNTVIEQIAEERRRQATSRTERAPWWAKKGQGVPGWMASPLTQEEAISRLRGRGKTAYGKALLEMWEEAEAGGAGMGPRKLATFTKPLQQDDGLLPSAARRPD